MSRAFFFRVILIHRSARRIKDEFWPKCEIGAYSVLKTRLILGKVSEIAEIIEKNRFKLLTLGAAETIFPAFPEDAGGRCSGETM